MDSRIDKKTFQMLRKLLKQASWQKGYASKSLIPTESQNWESFYLNSHFTDDDLTTPDVKQVPWEQAVGYYEKDGTRTGLGCCVLCHSMVLPNRFIVLFLKIDYDNLICNVMSREPSSNDICLGSSGITF